ncbi:hypothetical protein BDY19DRAFT_390512 [Irpex rosettiformis]|uniref:Uncharacterized protein n=1 Tax=Irpex rosettiformis TaxID=378272 RepID=A0ACB8TUK7_9APHY|nr:hypothetical protein BDY19DRAFT_390512 [Irpex rosettiformis]
MSSIQSSSFNVQLALSIHLIFYRILPLTFLMPYSSSILTLIPSLRYFASPRIRYLHQQQIFLSFIPTHVFTPNIYCLIRLHYHGLVL